MSDTFTKASGADRFKSLESLTPYQIIAFIDELPLRALNDTTHRTILNFLLEHEGILIPSTDEGYYAFHKDALRWIMKKSAGTAAVGRVNSFLEEYLRPGNVLSGTYLDGLKELLNKTIHDFEYGE